MPTKDELEQENARLRDRVEELEAEPRDVTGTGRARPAPERPEYGLSEGERQALEESGVTTSPFTGEQLNAHDEGVKPANPEARRRADKAQRPAERVPDNAWPLAGPPPAEGGDADATPQA
jgi:hypothetical protein